MTGNARADEALPTEADLVRFVRLEARLIDEKRFEEWYQRGGDSQRYAATAWHTLVWRDARLRIRLKRVDILNCDAALPSIQLFL